MSANSSENLFQSGQLQGAIDAALAEVKANPSDTDRRGLLAELLCINRDWERADKQIDTIGHQDPSSIVAISLIRQLIRGEVSRKECFGMGRPPELLDEPNDYLQKVLEALVYLRDGDNAAAQRLLNEAEDLRPHMSGSCDGTPFDDFRDLDDVAAGFFEVLTSTGKYYWIPIERVAAIEFLPPKRPRDLIWRQAEMTVEDGPYGDVYLPATYLGMPERLDDQLLLGRGSDWVEAENAPTRGLGQRTFLVGDEAIPIMQIEKLEFNSPHS